MATRAYLTSKEDMESMEVLEVFQDKDVLEAWSQYIDFLEKEDILDPSISDKRIDLLVDLLQKMAHALDYDIDKDYIRATSHSKIPLDHSEEQSEAIRQEMMEMLSLREAYL